MTIHRLGVISRITPLGAIALTGALALTACGSDNNSAGSTGSATSAASAGSSSGASAAPASGCGKGTLTAEGSTAQQKAIVQAIADYQRACSGMTVNYNGTGSGAGVKQFIAGQVNFAGSDSPLATDPAPGETKTEVQQASATCGSPALNLPMAAGAIAIAYNVKGVSGLVLDADTLAKILKGKITTWNDPAIAKLNSGASLPATAIKVFFRSDASGTTKNLTAYLNAKAPSVWTDAPSKSWSGAGEGKKGSADIATSVSGTDGGLGYMEQSYVKESKLNAAKIGTSASDALAPEGEAFAKAAAGGAVTATGNDVRVKFDYTKPAKGAYPIPIVTYEIVCSKYKDATVANNVKSFLKFWSTPAEQQAIAPIGYTPLPSSVMTKVTAAIASVS